MESSKTCSQAIYARFDSGENTEDLDKLVKNEELAICSFPTIKALWKCRYFSTMKILLVTDVMLKNYLDCMRI